MASSITLRLYVTTKTFTLAFIVIYVVISILAMLGIGYVIDWIPEASPYQQLRGYVIEGLTNEFQLKIAISAIASLVLISLLSRRRANQSRR